MSTRDDEVEIALEAVQADGVAGVGQVVRAGDRAGGLIDRRVLVGPVDPCGECNVCRRGGGVVCPHARRREVRGATITAAARWLVPLGDGLELPGPDAAAVAGDVTLAYTLYARTGIGPREPVVVIGATVVGRFLIEILRAKALSPVVVASAGPWADWLLGKGIVVAQDRAALAAAFAADSADTRPWRVICADPAATAAAADLAGPCATLTLLAGAALPPIAGGVIAREVSIIGVAGPHPDLVVEAAAMCVKREIDLAAGTTTTAGEPLRTQLVLRAERA